VHGLTAEALAACGVHVYLPMTGVVESLNLSVTGGIVLWEVARQRALLSHLQFGLAGPEQDLLVATLTDVSRGCATSPPSHT
jgi:tRNA C32,U32 (ribose-2'-O)-methylase TrmJ